MNKRKILKLLLSLMISSIWFLSFYSPVVAVNNIVSPKICARVTSCLLSKTNTYKNVNFKTEITTTNDLIIIIDYLEGEESGLNVDDDDRLFVVIKDKFGVGPTQKIFLNRNNTESGVIFTNTIKLPYHCDMICLEVYKQKLNDEGFVEKEENFIGKTNLLTANNLSWDRDGEGYEIVDKDCDEGSLFFKSELTPNIYSIRCPLFVNIAKIILPQGQENLMREEDKISSIYMRTLEGDSGPDRFYFGFSFYIPPTVNKFKVVLYEDVISDDSIAFESDFINLNLK